MAGDLRAGRLLIASPALADPNFARTVVLLLDADDTGALGVILNRPSRMPVESILPEWTDRLPRPDVIFSGGPVSGDAALAVAYTEAPVGGEVEGFRPVFDRVGIVDLDTPVERLSGIVSGLRVFAGYAGWGPGQLEDEIAEGAWFSAGSVHGDLFGDRPEQLWASVLRRQPGELAWVSTMPADPSLN
ncbi:MAG: YqgE/AlgH family protein [Nocardioidaceae bacterium]